jgi:hypothetical protein
MYRGVKWRRPTKQFAATILITEAQPPLNLLGKLQAAVLIPIKNKACTCLQAWKKKLSGSSVNKKPARKSVRNFLFPKERWKACGRKSLKKQA